MGDVDRVLRKDGMEGLRLAAQLPGDGEADQDWSGTYGR